MGLDITGMGAIADLATTVINKFFPDKTEQEKQQLAMAMVVIQGQLETNKEEAKNPSVFVSGWRPFVGWACGLGAAWNWVGLPVAKAVALIAFSQEVNLQPADLTEMLPLLLGMLGMGAIRMQEKIKGVAAS